MIGGMGRYELAEAPGPSMEAFLAALRAAYSNGGVLCARFHAVDVQDPGEWFHTGSNWHRNQTFQELFGSDVARGALPELQLPMPWLVADPPLFSGGAGGTLTLDGEWARCLVYGGAYRRFPGRAAEAKALTAAAVGELIGDRARGLRGPRGGAHLDAIVGVGGEQHCDELLAPLSTMIQLWSHATSKTIATARSGTVPSLGRPAARRIRMRSSRPR